MVLLVKERALGVNLHLFSWDGPSFFFFFFKDFIYLFMRDTEKEAETQAEGGAGSMQGARRGTHPGSPGSCPGLKAAPNC